MIDPESLTWIRRFIGSDADVDHGTWSIFPASAARGGYNVSYKAVGDNGPEVIALLWAASEAEAKLVVGLIEKLARPSVTTEEIVTGYRLRSSPLDRPTERLGFGYHTKIGGVFSFMQLTRPHDGWSALAYEPGRKWFNIFVARFYSTPYKQPRIDHKWPEIVADPMLTSFAVACELIRRYLAAGWKRYPE
jgi:hypothetical protein